MCLNVYLMSGQLLDNDLSDNSKPEVVLELPAFNNIVYVDKTLVVLLFTGS